MFTRLVRAGAFLAGGACFVFLIGAGILSLKLAFLVEEIRQANGRLFVWSSLPYEIEDATLTATFFFGVCFLLFLLALVRGELNFSDGLFLLGVTTLYLMWIASWGTQHDAPLWALGFGASVFVLGLLTFLLQRMNVLRFSPR